MIVVDDWHLLALLSSEAGETLTRLAIDGVATTNSWFFRLARAVRHGDGHGSISRAFAELPTESRAEVTELLRLLPPSVEVIHPRLLVPTMVTISGLRAANLLTLEAVATAVLTGATIVVSTESPLLNGIASATDVSVAVLA